jgi:hypothetical protein
MTHLHLKLRAIKLEANINRVYEIYLNKGLFNSWIVTTANGRYGGGMMQRNYSFFDLKEANTFAHKVLKKRLNAKKRIGVDYFLVPS